MSTSAFLRAISPQLDGISASIAAAAEVEQDAASHMYINTRFQALSRLSSVVELIDTIPLDYKGVLTDPLHAVYTLCTKLHKAQATLTKYQRHVTEGTLPAPFKGSPPVVQVTAEFGETEEGRTLKSDLEAAFVTYQTTALTTSVRRLKDQVTYLEEQLLPQKLYTDLRAIVTAQALKIMPLQQQPVFGTDMAGGELSITGWENNRAAEVTRDRILADCYVYAARVITIANVKHAEEGKKFKKRTQLSSAARMVAGDLDLDTASTSAASIKTMVERAVEARLRNHSEARPSPSSSRKKNGAKGQAKAPKKSGKDRNRQIEAARVSPNRDSYLALADFFLERLRQSHDQIPGQPSEVRPTALLQGRLSKLVEIRDQTAAATAAADSERSRSAPLSKRSSTTARQGRRTTKEGKGSPKGVKDTWRSVDMESTGVSGGPSIIGGSSRDVNLLLDAYEYDLVSVPNKPGCFISEGDLWVSNPSLIPERLLDLPTPVAINEIVSRMSLEMISTLSYQQDVHCSPGVHLPKELAFQISVGAKYMFHEPANTDLFLTAWKDFQRRLRWRINYLFETTGDKPYDPDYDVKGPSTKQAPALPLYIELGLIKGQRFVTSTIAKVPDVETLGHPHRSLQPDVRAIREFLLNNEFIITGTDKNLGIAVSKRDWIIEKSQDILNDVNNYRRLEHHEAIRILNSKCEAMEVLTDLASRQIDHFEGNVSDFMRSLITERGKEHHIPQFYGIPKIHKQPVKMRPIIPCHSAIMNPAAKYVSKKLKPLIKAAPTIIHGTKDLAQKLSALSLDTSRNWYIVTGDVVAYYPNIPLQHCMDIVYDQYLEFHWAVRDHDDLRNRHMQDFFKACMEVGNTRLLTQFQNQVYEQLNGLAMGVACSPDLANLYGAYFENKCKVLEHNDIYYYGRYIDDCLAIVYAESEQHAITILSDLIQFDNCVITWDCNERHAPFLDMMLYKDEDNTLQHMPYRKTGNHQERIPWISAHPYDVKRGTFLGEMSRLATLSSTLEHYLAAMRSLVALYIRRGYPADDVHKWLYANLSKRWESRLSNRESVDDGTEILVLKTQYNIAWNYFNSHELGDVIFGYWREWLERADAGTHNLEFPAPGIFDLRSPQSGADEAWDLRKTKLFNSKVILSRKRTRNFLDISNLWKRTVIQGISGMALDDNISRMQRGGTLKRPYVPDVNAAVVGPRPKIARVDHEDNSHLPLHRQFPEFEPRNSEWSRATMGTWGRGRLA